MVFPISKKIVRKTATGAAGLVTAAIMTVAPAVADPNTDPTPGANVVPFGQTATLSGGAGSEITDYTVGPVQPSGRNDGVWFSDVSVKAEKGPVTPIIGDFNARAADGATYTVLEGTQPDGLSNQPVAPGGERHGRIYFQVGAGAPPDSVVYSQGQGGTKLVWKS